MRNQEGVVFKRIAVALAFLASQAGLAGDDIGSLALVNGDVRIAKSESDPGKPAKLNEGVKNTDVVKTGANSSAKILFTDDTIMDVGASSALQVSNYAIKNGDNRTGSYNLMYGKLRSFVTKKVGDGGKVEVKTPTAVMGVRGTEFVVDSPKPSPGSPPPAPSVVVVSGTVQVAPPTGGPGFTVGAGQMMTVQAQTFSSAGGNSSSGKGTSGGGDSPVQKASADQLKSAVEGSKTEDKTFMSQVTVSPSQSSGQSNTAMTNLTALVTSSVALPPPSTDSGSSTVKPPEILGNAILLPPVNIIPGNAVTLTVTVQ